MRPLRHILCMLLLTLLPLGGSAEELVTPQTITSRVSTCMGQKGVARIYVFSGLKDAMMKTSANADWYEYPNLTTPISSSTNLFSDLQDGGTYLVKMGGRMDTFAVFDYSRYRIAGHTISADLTCEGSVLSMDINPMKYYLLSGQSVELEREFTISYTNLKKDSTTWREGDIETILIVSRPRVMDLHAKVLMQTAFKIEDNQFVPSLCDTPDIVQLPIEDVHPIAIDFIPKSYTTLRGDKPENENQRVTKSEILTGSAPLNVLFQSNATPLTDFFYWEILRSTEMLSSRTEPDTRYIFDESGKYSVKLKVWNQHECACDTTFQVDAKESLLAVPNVFTPNGDGVNDEFRVVYRSIKSYSIVIYNRWQHLIYESSDPAKGWNGRINGKKAPEGAYYYIIKATGSDGEEYVRKGAVNLLRGGQ